MQLLMHGLIGIAMAAGALKLTRRMTGKLKQNRKLYHVRSIYKVQFKGNIISRVIVQRLNRKPQEPSLYTGLKVKANTSQNSKPVRDDRGRRYRRSGKPP